MTQQQKLFGETGATPAIVDVATAARHIGEHAHPVAYPDRTTAAAEDQGFGRREITPMREVGQRGVAIARTALDGAAANHENWHEADIN